MELPQFKAAVAEATTLLKVLQTLIPERVDKELTDYLDRLQADPVGLELLRNAVRPATPR